MIVESSEDLKELQGLQLHVPNVLVEFAIKRWDTG